MLKKEPSFNRRGAGTGESGARERAGEDGGRGRLD